MQVGTAVGVLIYVSSDILANSLTILVETDRIILVEGREQLQKEKTCYSWVERKSKDVSNGFI